MNDTQRVISVCMITYNQSQTIQQAIESVLSQKGDFRLELVIGDDASSDGTRELCEAYAHKYPDRIVFTSNEINMGPVRNGLTVLSCCSGQYIAFLEGDDYWCCDDKIETQLRFLEEHQDYSMVYCRSRVVNKNGEIVGQRYQYPGKEIRTMDDLCSRGSHIISTASIFGRNIFTDIRQIKDLWTETAFIGDVFLKSLYLHAGRIGYIDREMVVYRQITDGENSFSSLADRRKHELITDSFKALIRHYSGEKLSHAESMIKEYEKEDNILLTVIIPIADCEEKFDAYLRHIFETAFENIEIISVIQGNCGIAIETAKRWYAAEKRFQYYIQQTGDVSEARNIGLEHARGRFVTFWDCDDEMNPDCYIDAAQKLAENDADILILNFCEREGETVIHKSKLVDTRLSFNDGAKLADYLISVFFHYKCGFQLWNKIIRRDLIEDNQIRFFPRQSVCAEDLLYCLCCLAVCRTLLTDTSIGYTYLHRRGSLTDRTAVGFKIPAYIEGCRQLKCRLERDTRIGPYVPDLEAEMMMVLCRENGHETVVSALKDSDNPVLDIVLQEITDRHVTDCLWSKPELHMQALAFAKELLETRKRCK